jgi:hypothetical protein
MINLSLKLLRNLFVTVCLLLVGIPLFSHPMPNSLIFLSLKEKSIGMEIQMPVQEFELAFGKDLLNQSDKILTLYSEEIKTYLYQHIQIKTIQNIPVKYTIKTIALDSAFSEANGKYLEIQAHLESEKNEQFNPRDFILMYDVIIHQVVNHFAVIRINQDFNNGITAADSVEIGLIQLDIASNTIKPLHLKIEEGSTWRGFKSMFDLGMKHIRIGTDHILFLLTLLLISPLTVIEKKWSLFQGFQFTAKRFLSISIAFTIGHSLALMIGAYSLFPIPVKLIEILIAISILLSAFNCIQPIFKQKESLVALGFGAIHGLAFSEALVDLDLETMQKLWSILGFNVGIEAMQIIIMGLFFPILWMSKFKVYHYLRVAIAIFTIFAAFVWLIERITDAPTYFSFL